MLDRMQHRTAMLNSVLLVTSPDAPALAADLSTLGVRVAACAVADTLLREALRAEVQAVVAWDPYPALGLLPALAALHQHHPLPVLLFTSRVAGGADAFEGVLGGTSYYWGLEDRLPSARKFNDAFRAAYNGAVPSDFGSLGYAGILSVLQAVKNADATDSQRVSVALRQLKYDWYKGPQFYRKCDHQSVQPVVIVESKSKGMKDKNDVFSVLAIEDANEKNLRTCEEMGHKAG